MSRPALRWYPNLWVTVLAVVFLPLLLLLGNWQLGRAEEKAALLAQFEQLRSEPLTPASELPSSAPDYTPAKVTGVYDNERTFLLDNRPARGRYGVEVITPVIPTTGERVLVNRGWIAADPGRRSLPAVPPVSGEVTVTGYVYRESARWGREGEAPRGDWPKLIQGVDPDHLEAYTDYPLAPFVIRADAAAPGALLIDWPVVNQQPATHIGYAVQWFALALALAAAWLMASSNLWQVLKGDGGD